MTNASLPVILQISTNLAVCSYNLSLKNDKSKTNQTMTDQPCLLTNASLAVFLQIPTIQRFEDIIIIMAVLKCWCINFPI